MCVWGGGGGYSLLSFIYRSPREEDAESCRDKIIIISTITKSFSLHFFYFLLFMSIIFYVLQACIAFVVLLFRLYVTKLMCVKVEIARGLLKYLGKG